MKKILLALVALFIVVPLLLTSGCGGGGGSSSGGSSGGNLGKITFRVMDATDVFTYSITIDRKLTHTENAAWVKGQLDSCIASAKIKPLKHYRGTIVLNGNTTRAYCDAHPCIKNQVLETCAKPLEEVTKTILETLVTQGGEGQIVVTFSESVFP